MKVNASTARSPTYPRVLGRSIRTTAVKRVCKFYFPLIHIVFLEVLPRQSTEGGSLAYWEERGGLKVWTFRLSLDVFHSSPRHTIARRRGAEIEHSRKP